MLKHKIKKEEGSGLVLTLMVLLVLSVLGASVATVTMGSNRLGHATQDSNSAYYIAEAGANMAYEEIRQGVVNAYDNNNELGVQTTIDSLPDEYNNFDMQSGHQPEAHVSVSEPETEGNKKTYTITSTGKIGPSSRTVTKEFVVTWVDKSTDTGAGFPEIDIDASIIARNYMSFTGGEINGDVYLDSLEKRSFTIGTWGNINSGKIFSSYSGGNYRDVYAGTSSRKDYFINRTEPLDEKIKWNDYQSILDYIYLPDNFNEYLKPDIYLGYGSRQINQNSYIKTLTLAGGSILNIHANTDVNLFFDKLKIPQGFINVIGNGKVNLYIRDELTMGGGSAINKNIILENPLNIYYFGNASLNLTNDVSIEGNLLVDQADINFGGSGRINGAVISGGNKITITGGSINKTMIIQPNIGSQVEFSNGKIDGVIVSDRINMSNGTLTAYKFDPGLLFPGLGSVEDSDPSIGIDIEDLINTGPSIEK